MLKNKTVLITGGAGFIGSHVADEFVNNNYTVILVDNFATGKKCNLNQNAKFYEIDIRDKSLEKIFEENKIEYVVHNAAQASVAVSMRRPEYDMSVNLQGTLNLLQLSVKYKVKKFIVASTAAVYGHPVYLPIDEKHPVSCLSFYGLSKYTMEQYIKLFGIDYIIFRYSNVYGPRQDAHGEAGVIAILIDKMTKHLPIEIHGDGLQTRDFIHVSDIAQANLKAVESEVKNMTINVSSNSNVSILRVFDTIKTITGYKNKAVYTSPRIGDIKDSLVDNSLALEILGWNPKINLPEGLIETTNKICNF